MFGKYRERFMNIFSQNVNLMYFIATSLDVLIGRQRRIFRLKLKHQKCLAPHISCNQYEREGESESFYRGNKFDIKSN